MDNIKKPFFITYHIIRNVPAWKQRIAGKSVPMEKFAVRKAERFLSQDNHLCLPAIELIYVWNGFKILGQQYHLVEPIYVLIENTISKLEKHKDEVKFYNEDLCLLNLLMAMCLKHMKSPLQVRIKIHKVKVISLTISIVFSFVSG